MTYVENIFHELLKYESVYHRKLSLVVHITIVIYLMALLYAERKTPKGMLVGLGVFTMIYGLSIVWFGLEFRG